MVSIRVFNRENSDVRFDISYRGFDNIPIKKFTIEAIENKYGIKNAVVVTFDRYMAINLFDVNYSAKDIYDKVLDKYKKYFIINERRKYWLFGKKIKKYYLKINAPQIMFTKDTIRVSIVTTNITIIDEYEGENNG